MSAKAHFFFSVSDYRVFSLSTSSRFAFIDSLETGGVIDFIFIDTWDDITRMRCSYGHGYGRRLVLLFATSANGVFTVSGCTFFSHTLC